MPSYSSSPHEVKREVLPQRIVVSQRLLATFECFTTLMRRTDGVDEVVFADDAVLSS